MPDSHTTDSLNAETPTSSNNESLKRREFVKLSAIGVVGGMAAFGRSDAFGMPGGKLPPTPSAVAKPAAELHPAALSIDDLRTAQKVAGLNFRDEHLELMLEGINERLEGYTELRKIPTPNGLLPSLQFDPRISGASIPSGSSQVTVSPDRSISRPPTDDDLAFMTVEQLSALISSRQVSSIELTNFFLERLERVGKKLEAVVTLTPERARKYAQRADAELQRGEYRGPLHGIPYGAKDLLSVAGYPTTWGAVPYQNQQIESDAAVVQKLDDAGAILVAKLTLGALAWGDVWFGGMTRNPWNIDQGSSGSSAGPGSAVAAGLIPFAIGSETLGSIVSPSTRNGVSGHRPTYGLVSRAGAMTLSWSMDKLGPMTRSAVDCALVFDAIRGRDSDDPSTVSAPFRFDATSDLSQLRVGYVAEAFEQDYPNRPADKDTLQVVRDLGVRLTPVSWPKSIPVGSLMVTLSVEAAAAFDELTRTNGVDTMVRQIENAWPNEFRAARFVPAVEFLQANRHRVTLMQQMQKVMNNFDVVISPSFGGGTLQITNLTGHPAVCVPNNFLPVEDHEERRSPRSITFVGALYNDAAALRLAHAYQNATEWHRMRPPVR